MSSRSRPLVSICIANYNGEHLLDACIGSIREQDDAIPVEIIVHDDASTDTSLSLLRTRHPDVRVIQSEQNVGFCIANNRMVEAASGEFVLLLNNDAALMRDALRVLLEDATRRDDGAILTLPQYDWRTGMLVDRGCLLDPFHVPVPNLDMDREEVAYVIGACLWVPRARWHQLGGFPDWFGSIAEDMYLGCVARLRGMPVRCVNRSGYLHRQGASFGGNRADNRGLRTRYRRRYLSERNRLWLIAIYLPTQLAWPWLGVHIAALMLEGAVLALLLRDRSAWSEIYGRAIIETWRARGLLRQQRCLLQRTRIAGLSRVLSPYRWVPWKLGLLIRHGLPRIS